MQTVNLLTIEWQLRVKGSNIYHYIVYQISPLTKKFFKKSQLFFKTRFKIFFLWLILARSVGAQFFRIQIYHPFKITSVQIRVQFKRTRNSKQIKIEIDKNRQQSSDFYRLISENSENLSRKIFSPESRFERMSEIQARKSLFGDAFLVILQLILACKN